MALDEYIGCIVLEVDGQEIDVVAVDPTERTGRKLVKTMNAEGRAKGFARGVAEFDLKVTVAIPAEGDMDWAAIEGAKLTIYPQSGGGTRTSYLDCFTVEVGERYQVDNEAVRDISMAAMRKEPE